MKNMKNCVILFVVLAMLTIGNTTFAQSPGTPVGWSGDTLDLYDGDKILPGPVEPGDVVMRENPQGGDGRENWSDVVRFYNAPNPVTGQNTGHALLISDGEHGINNIGLTFIAICNDGSAQVNQFLLDALNDNHTFLQEGPADPTLFPVTNLNYHIHSDVSEIEPPPGPKLPGALLVAGNLVVNIGESATEENVTVFLPQGLVLQPGTADVYEEIGGELSDTLEFTATTVKLKWSDPGSMEPVGDDPYVVFDSEGDLGTTATFYLIDGPEVPEPATLLLLGLGGLMLRKCRA